MQEINKVKGYRTMIGLTQDDMAAMLGVTKTTYYNKENGITKFSMDELKKIKEAVVNAGISITIDDLF